MGSKDNKQVGKNTNFWQSFSHAIDGCKTLLKTERNLRFHLVVALLIIILAGGLHVGWNQFLWLLLAIFVVLTAEVLNSIVERIVDLLVGNHFNQLAKEAKDMAAGGVLLATGFAMVVGIIVFLPLLIKLIPWR
ncbi:diacylglycerol kinase family protein [Nicoliella lavandulae]|uniref:Diacylglycerol kinase family protein n=1 Tax=Nicoliella lavandulae TaxID=3082954 RepID=A0ABU8SLA1_9LACO